MVSKIISGYKTKTPAMWTIYYQKWSIISGIRPRINRHWDCFASRDWLGSITTKQHLTSFLVETAWSSSGLFTKSIAASSKTSLRTSRTSLRIISHQIQVFWYIKEDGQPRFVHIIAMRKERDVQSQQKYTKTSTRMGSDRDMNFSQTCRSSIVNACMRYTRSCQEKLKSCQHRQSSLTSTEELTDIKSAAHIICRCATVPWWHIALSLLDCVKICWVMITSYN